MPLINAADVNTAMTLARDKYESVTLPEFIARKAAGRVKLHLVFLHMKKPKEGVNTFKTYRGKDRSKTNTESFDRFFLFGVSGGSDVLVVFTKTSEETITFLRYAGQGLAIRPGSEVYICGARHRNNACLSATSNLVLMPTEPLIPAMFVDGRPQLLPEFIPKSSDFRYFVFETYTLCAANVNLQLNVCDGELCDGQTVTDPCGCVKHGLKRSSWALEAELEADELQGELLDQNTAVFVSRSSAALFAPDANSIDPTSSSFDSFRFADAVTDCINYINNNGGWRVQGWFKPAGDFETIGFSETVLHIVALQPCSPGTTEHAEYRRMQYKPTAPSVSLDIPAVVRAGRLIPTTRQSIESSPMSNTPHYYPMAPEPKVMTDYNPEEMNEDMREGPERETMPNQAMHQDAQETDDDFSDVTDY